jgi:predicted CopG family antitoxin
MGTKTISISDEAYSKLKALKRGKESFTDAILRLTGRKSLSEITGFLSEKEAEEMRRVIGEMREKSRARTFRWFNEAG